MSTDWNLFPQGGCHVLFAQSLQLEGPGAALCEDAANRNLKNSSMGSWILLGQPSASEQDQLCLGLVQPVIKVIFVIFVQQVIKDF